MPEESLSQQHAILIYRRSLSFRSGAGQLIAMQVRGLRAAGVPVRLLCQRGALRFLLQSGLLAHRVRGNVGEKLVRRSATIIVDHEMELPDADVVFSHNLMTEAVRHLPRRHFAILAERERRFFDRLRPDALIVANSSLVRSALISHFNLEPERVRVCYPGFRSSVFDGSKRNALRRHARNELGIAMDAPVVGFVTSGDLEKRGLDIFLSAASEVAHELADARFLVVGSKRLPDWAGRHPLLRQNRLHFRPRGARPALWMSALDVFLYPARFEEFGMVVLEASALGIPVLTSRLVGASECLPEEFDRWLIPRPDSESFAARAIEMLGDSPELERLSSASRTSAAAFDDARFVRASIALIGDQKR